MRDVLIIETSTTAASIALAVDGRIVEEKGFNSSRRHNALLFQPLGEIVESYGRRSFAAVLVGSGPGSYSGTRVGIAAAQGAALVAGCRAVAVPSILAVSESLSGMPCLAVGDARRGSFWLAKISGGNLIETPALTDKIGFESALRTAERSGTAVFSMEPIPGVNICCSLPTAGGLWKVWQAATPQSRSLWAGKIPQPIYLSPPHITPSKKAVFGNR